MLPTFQRFLASGLGSGYSPIAPGTSGSIAACVLLFFGLMLFGISFLVGFVVFSVVANFWTAPAAEAAWGKDPGAMVLDEWAGMGISLWSWLWTIGLEGGELSLVHLLVAFGFFRLFDIWKPLGVNSMQKLNGGFGILFDDILAGWYAGIGWFIVFQIW